VPGLLVTRGKAERTEPLLMVGPKGLERVVTALRTIAPELPFEIECREITEAEQTFFFDGFQIKAFKVNHSVVCYGYSMMVKRGGRFDRERALEQQITLLTLKKEHLENLIDLACGIKMIGVNKLDFAVFDTKKIDEYARQAKEAWGKTPAYREYKEKQYDKLADIVWIATPNNGGNPITLTSPF